MTWQSVAVPNGDFEQSGAGATIWTDGGSAGLSNSGADYAGDLAIDVLAGWQFAAGSASRSLMASGARVADPAVGGGRGQVARIEYAQGSRGHAAGYLTSDPIPGLTIPASGGRFRMEVSHFVTGQARGVNFGFLTGPVTMAADVTHDWISGDASNDAWGSPYELHAGTNTRHEGTTPAWVTTRIYWDNTGTLDETFGLGGAIVTLPNGREGYASETVDGTYTIRHYTDKRGVGESLRLGAFVRTNSGGGTGRLFLDGFSLAQESLLPAGQRWHGDGMFPGGPGTWVEGGGTWGSGTAVGRLAPGAMATFPLPDGDVTVHEEGVTVTGGLTFEAATAYRFAGGPLTLGGAAATANTVLVQSAATATIAAPLVGAAGLLKAGAGELVLAGGGHLTGDALVAEGTLRLAHAAGLGTAAVFVSGGTLAVGVDATLGDTRVDFGGSLVLDAAATQTLRVASLTLDRTNGGAAVDLGVGRIEIRAAADVTALEAELAAGRGLGAEWTGSEGIRSSAAAASGGTRSVGYRVAGDGSATLAFAAPGDVDLDGVVNTLDLVAIAASGRFGKGLSAAWADGDFNADGVVNTLDLVAIASAGVWGTGSYLPVPLAPAPVPEPAAPLLVAAVMAAACGVGLLRSDPAAARTG